RKRDAPKLVARVGNALHIPTRAGVVRRTLLVKVGDRYDSAKVAESERALRALTVFRAVRIDTVRKDGRLALRVETDDAWSTIPDFHYASVAGDVMWAVAFTEANVAGTATALTGRYEKTPDRHSLSIGYSSTGVLGRRTVLTPQHKTISDGRSGRVVRRRSLLRDRGATLPHDRRCRSNGARAAVSRRAAGRQPAAPGSALRSRWRCGAPDQSVDLHTAGGWCS